MKIFGVQRLLVSALRLDKDYIAIPDNFNIGNIVKLHLQSMSLLTRTRPIISRPLRNLTTSVCVVRSWTRSC